MRKEVRQAVPSISVSFSVTTALVKRRENAYTVFNFEMGDERVDEKQRAAYETLITDVQASYAEEQNGLVWCGDCQEINLWTYWQGRNADKVKILLVGQDWGSICTEETQKWVKKLCIVPEDGFFPYMEENKSLTDKNLVELFRTIGYNVDKNEEKNRELFFTNFVLGYRKDKKISGGYRGSWGKHDGVFFARLVNILDPEYMFCLGRNTFEGALTALNQPRPKIHRYNDFLQSEQNPVSVHLDDGRETKICALAHCGGMGTANRNRDGRNHADPLEQQKQDWKWVQRKG